MAERSTDLRERIVRAAADLLASGGGEAVSTRAVSAAAGVQAPAIYRQFADMQQLVRAAAREVLARYVRKKATRKPTDDPLQELRSGWDLHVAFGLANTAAYVLLYGAPADAAGGSEVRDGLALLEALVARIAEQGRLRVSVMQAARMVHAGACGVTLSLIASPPGERDMNLSAAMRETVLAGILDAPSTQPPRSGGRVATRAVALRAVLQDAKELLSGGELQLLGEWLGRLAADDHPPSSATNALRRAARRRRG